MVCLSTSGMQNCVDTYRSRFIKIFGWKKQKSVLVLETGLLLEIVTEWRLQNTPQLSWLHALTPLFVFFLVPHPYILFRLHCIFLVCSVLSRTRYTTHTSPTKSFLSHFFCSQDKEVVPQTCSILVDTRVWISSKHSRYYKVLSSTRWSMRMLFEKFFNTEDVW